MGTYKQREEEKKRRRAEMMEKYPSQNPRENVRTMLLRTDEPNVTVPLGVAKSNSREAYEPAIQLTEAGKMQKRVRTQLETAKSTTTDRAFARKAANGWKAYQTDEANRAIREKDPGYQRWKSMSGYGETDDPIYKPAVNWSVDENNTFGYLYGENKQRAYDYAKAINSRLSRRMERIGSSLREGAQEQREKSANFWEDIWSTYTKAQGANSTAHEKSAEQIGNAGKAVGERIKAGAQASAQVQIARAEQNRTASDDTAKAVQQAVKTAWNLQAEIERNNSEQQVQRGKNQAERIGELGHTWGKTTGVTGSDQTGASIHGYREDTSYKEPNDEWTSGERQLYAFHLKNNPEEAERYAIRTNNRYNQKKKQKQMDEERQRMNEKEVLALEAGGARVLSGLKSLDGYNSLLEYSATGRISTNPEITPGEYSQIIDDSIADKIEKKGDKLAANVYRFGTNGIDGISTFAIGGPVLEILRSAGESVTDTLKQEKERGATDKQAAERAFFKSAGNAVIDAAGEIGTKFLTFKNGKYLSGEVKQELVGETVPAMVQGIEEFEEYKREYKKQGYSDKQAEHIAIFEAMKKGGMRALDNIALNPAQKKFYNSLQKSFSRMF